jgi:diguanylate cyclase (GGDEF)-like protein
MPDPWVLLDPMRAGDGRIVDFRYVDANDASCAANGMSRSELLGRTLLELLPEHSPTGLLEAYAQVIETGQPLALDDEPFADRLDPGTVRRFDNRGVRIGGRLSFTWRDVTDRYEARRVLAEQARLDDLTGLPNRMQLRERLAAAFARRPRTGQSIAILYCDLDDFKPINDLHGHANGDVALREVARRIAASVRAQDTIARLGGDEFVAVLEGVHTADDAVTVAEKVRDAVRAPITVGGHAVRTTMSIGIALAEPGERPELVLEHADSALYAAKALGGDRAELYRAVDHAAI